MSPVAKIFAGIALIVIGVVLAPFTGGLSLQLVAIGGSLLLQGVIGLFTKKSTNDEIAKVNVRLPEPIRWIHGGTNRAGGACVFAEFDSAGNLWYVVIHSDSLMVERLSVLLDDVTATFDGSGNVINDEFCLNSKNEPFDHTKMFAGARRPYVQIWTTTYSESNPTPPGIAALMSAFPGKWTSDHKIVGTTYSVVMMKALKAEDRGKIYKWRGPLGMGEPSIAVIAKFAHAYDPRDGGQTNGTPTTYGFTLNSVLLWAWWRTHRYGRNKARDTINWTKVGEQATIADQVVAGLVGDHVRYQASIAVPDDKQRVEAEQELLLTMDAQLIFDEDGKCWPRVGHYDTPTLSLTRNRDIVAMESIEAQDGESETQGVIVRYTDPAAKYIAQPAAAWYNPLYYVEGQSASFLTVDILACQDHNQAMRLAKAIGMRSQPLHKIAPTIGLRGLKARGERIINLNYDNVFSGDYEIATQVELDAVGIFCGAVMVPVDENRWTLLPGEERPKPVVDNIDTVTSPDLPTGVVFTYNNGRIEATFDAPSRFDVGYEFQYIATTDLASENWLNMTVRMVDVFAYGGAVPIDVEYSLRYRSVAASGRVSDWSTPLDTLTGTSVFPPPSSFNVVPSTGNAAVSWRNPTDARFAYTRTYRGTTTVFGAATDISGAITGGLGQVQGFTDTIAAGTYYYWIIAFMTDGTPSAASGPVTAVVL